MLAAALSRRWSIAGLVTLALAGASSGIAVGKATNSGVRFVPHVTFTFVKVILPHKPITAGFHDPLIGVEGETQKSARGTEFVQMQPCKPTPTAEVALVREEKAFSQIGQSVDGPFTVVRNPYQRFKKGKNYACAYLQEGSSSGATIATAEKPFDVV